MANSQWGQLNAQVYLLAVASFSKLLPLVLLILPICFLLRMQALHGGENFRFVHYS